MGDVTPPVLRTPRLVLRAHRPEDLRASAAMWADPRVVRHIGGKPQTREEAWGKVLRYRGLWALLGYGYWAVTRRSDGRFLGEAGLADFRREVRPRLDAPEAGWALARAAHGRGYATEAVRAVLAWADAALPARRTVCLIDPGNAASFRVARKCGYRPLRRARYKGAETSVLSRPRAAL